MEKNNKRFIIYSITALKKYFDKKIYDQKIDLYNVSNKINTISKTYVKKDELDSYEYASIYDLDRVVYKDELKDELKDTLKNELDSYVSKNELDSYVSKNELDSYVSKNELDSYVSKKDFINYTLKNTSQELNKTQDTHNIRNNKIDKSEKYKILSKIVDAIIKDSKNDKENETDELYDVYKPNWYK